MFRGHAVKMRADRRLDAFICVFFGRFAGWR